MPCEKGSSKKSGEQSKPTSKGSESRRLLRISRYFSQKLPRIAYHEAGHAVLAWTFGLEIEGVRIKPDEGSRGKAAVGSWEGVSGYCGDSEEALLRAHALTMLAGEVAGEVYSGVPIDWDEHSDWKGSDIDLYTDLAVRLGWFEKDVGGVLDLQPALVERVAEVRGLLEERWAAVEAVANALLASDELSGEDAMRTMEEAACPGPVASVWSDFQKERREEEEIERLQRRMFVTEDEEERQRLYRQLVEGISEEEA